MLADDELNVHAEPPAEADEPPMKLLEIVKLLPLVPLVIFIAVWVIKVEEKLLLTV